MSKFFTTTAQADIKTYNDYFTDIFTISRELFSFRCVLSLKKVIVTFWKPKFLPSSPFESKLLNVSLRMPDQNM